MSDSPFGHEHKRSNCFATWYIGRKAKSLAGKYGFDDDASDVIFQDLTLHLIKIWPQYDPGLSQPITFIHEVVDRKIRELIRLQKRMKRDYRLEVPLTEASDPASCGDPGSGRDGARSPQVRSVQLADSTNPGHGLHRSCEAASGAVARWAG